MWNPRWTVLAERGRIRYPKRVHLVTYTLKYPRMHWLTIDALDEHWTKAEVEAEVLDDSKLEIVTKNVAALSLNFPTGKSPFDLTRLVTISINGQTLEAPQSWTDRSWNAKLRRVNGKWKLGGLPTQELRKRQHLQGPIDDALMDSFIFVRPTGESWHPSVDRWVTSELSRAIEHWRRQFRGDARIKDDSDITEADIQSANLVLWGDPNSNQIIKRIASKLPIKWTEDSIQVGNHSHASADNVLIQIYPNPLNPSRYVVLNSSFTYREYAYLNNARQVPMLPDWAIVSFQSPPGTQYPGKIVAADFFNETWELKPTRDDKESKRQLIRPSQNISDN